MSKFFKSYGALSNPTRRDFLKYTGLAAGALASAPYFLRAQNANGKIRVACVGVGGKGDSDCDSAASMGELVAICDVDENTLNKKGQKHPNAKKYKDFRKMLEENEKSIDAVTVSTPDHCHGIVAAMAMKMGKHVYCQKPLVQTVYEARVLRKLAKEKNLCTQMGNQGSAGNGLRRAVEVIQGGVIGQVKELHVWSNRPIWPQGLDRPQGEDPVPPTLDWDLWLGPAEFRPYKKGVYHAFNWRGWFDYGTGALGDMACHTVNMPFRALKMGYPSVVEYEMGSRFYPETFPKTSRIRFEFPEREGLAPLKFWWYDGNPGDALKPLRPDANLVKDLVAFRDKLDGSGCLLIGEKGQIFSPDDYGSQFYIKMKDEKEFVGGDRHEACKAVPQSIPRSPGHDKEWFEAMKAGKPELAYSNFEIAGYLTEIILLGCVALRVGEGRRLDWDGPSAQAKNVDVSQFTKRTYRKGFELAAQL